jgi:hypothetical protein
MEEALMAYLAEPERLSEMLAAIADYKIALIERFDDVADLDMIWYGDDWGTQRSLFMPPDVWRATIKPHTARIYDAMKARGILINQHSCGVTSRLWATCGDGHGYVEPLPALQRPGPAQARVRRPHRLLWRAG